ncbi:TPA: hypothetical protein EYP66_22760 [Candidatus Poribacteria bacterium]|nr:hypothetical protein [Candidatus Poribacteria bacterium]
MNNLQLIRNKRGPLVFSLLLLTTVLCASAIGDDVKPQSSATYIFGKVEVLRSDSSDWEFLKRNAPLSSDDLIRMPPISLLRIKEKDGVAFPAFHGSRELRVSQLIAEGRKRITSSKGKRLDTDLDGGIAIDILPTGNPNITAANLPRQTKSETVKIPPTELRKLRFSLQHPSDALKAYALSKLEQIYGNQQDSFQPNGDGLRREITVYPGKNILQARCLFDALRSAFAQSEFRIPNSAFRILLLYGQMLQSIGIKVDFISNSKDELCLIFDSGRKTDEIGRITANRTLVYPDEQNLWIPISISDVNNNFTHAWYIGSQLANEE